MSQNFPDDHPANGVAKKVLDAAFQIHKQYGAGLMESAYEHILMYELKKQFNFKVERQKMLPIYHDNHRIDAGYKLDLIVEDMVIIELKCIEKILPVHEAQLITYLKLTNVRLGLILNFKTTLLKHGIRRLVV